MRIRLSKKGSVILNSLQGLINRLSSDEDLDMCWDEAVHLVFDMTGMWYHCLAMLTEPGIEIHQTAGTDYERAYKLSIFALEELEGEIDVDAAWNLFEIFFDFDMKGLTELVKEG